MHDATTEASGLVLDNIDNIDIKEHSEKENGEQQDFENLSHGASIAADNAANNNLKNDQFDQPIGNLKILCLGDSHTAGAGVDEALEWPEQLNNFLASPQLTSPATAATIRAATANSPNTLATPATDKPIIENEIRVIAQNGWTTGDLKFGLAKANLIPAPAKQSFDWTVILIGVNNQFQNYPTTPRNLDNFSNGFEQIVKNAINLSRNNANRVIVMSIPNWGKSPFGQRIISESSDPVAETLAVSKEINTYNHLAKQIVSKYAVQWLDLGATLQAHVDDRSYYTQDGIHYSGKMHALWAQLVAQRIRQAYIQ